VSARLDTAAAAALTEGPALSLPYRRAGRGRIGIVHLGIGAFHRAHQAVYTEDAALADGDDRWGICGVTQRSATVQRQLGPQDGLYGVLQRSSTEPTTLRISGAVGEVLDGGGQVDQLLDRLAATDTHLVTLTVTEKGYRRAADGRLDTADPQVAADLAGAAEPATAIGRLVRGLQRRLRTGGSPVTVLSCDNLNHNGRVVAGLVQDFCAALPGPEAEPLLAWLADRVTFPSSMVDRIVPATTDADRAAARAITGLDDAGLVVAEPFRQWVIEDRFAGPRPAWPRAGAQLTDDVTPYELMKLRLLNGSHSTLAYLGALRGHRTIADAVADPQLHAIAEQLIRQDMIPTVPAPDGVDLLAYGDQVLHRYTNADLRHTCVQIAMDGSQKLPQRLVAPALAAIGLGRRPQLITLGIAAWMAYVALGRSAAGAALPLDDPLAERLGRVRGSTDAGRVVDDLLGLESIFGRELPEIGWWRAELRTQLRELLAGAVPGVGAVRAS
jgi:fructuronate reductase